MSWETQDRPGRRVPATAFRARGKTEDDVNGPSMEEPDELTPHV